MLDDLDDKAHLEKIISELPQFPTQDKAQEAYSQGKLKDGELFQITEVDGWKVAVWVKGKLPFVFYEKGVYSDKRLEVLKRKGVARLIDIAQNLWVPTAQMPYLPQRYQNIESGKVLFTEGSIENSLADARHDNAVIDPLFHPVN